MYSILKPFSRSYVPVVRNVFAKEADMAPIVSEWMRSAGLTVKSEFHLPWGICDLVGVALNPERVAHRHSLKQGKAIGSIASTAILLQIPDVESRRSVSIDLLHKRCGAPVTEIEAAVEQLVAGRFVVKTRRGNLQKVNGWMPLEDRLIAVELKLFRIDEALKQASDHLEFATASYVAFPEDVTRRIVARPSRWSTRFDNGIGLIAVNRDSCSVVIEPSAKRQQIDTAIRAYCVEKFWRTRARDKYS